MQFFGWCALNLFLPLSFQKREYGWTWKVGLFVFQIWVKIRLEKRYCSFDARWFRYVLDKYVTSPKDPEHFRFVPLLLQAVQ